MIGNHKDTNNYPINILVINKLSHHRMLRSNYFGSNQNRLLFLKICRMIYGLVLSIHRSKSTVKILVDEVGEVSAEMKHFKPS